MRNVFITTAMAAVFSLGATVAQAMPHVVSLTFDPTGIAGFTTTTGTGLSLRIRPLGSQSITPFTVAEGDSIETTITFTGGLVLNNGTSPLGQLFSLSYSDSTFDFFAENPSGDPVGTYDRSSSAVVNSFTGVYSGDVTGTPISATPNGPSFSASVLGDFTSTSITVFQITMNAVFTNISYLPGFESLAGHPVDTVSLSIFDELDQVPAPGALALLGLGVLGLAAARRRVA